MAEAPRDSNRVPTLLGESNAVAGVPITVYVDPSTHRMLVNTTVTGSISAGTSLIEAVLVGQTTSHASTPQQLNGGSSIPATNGVLVQALAANTNNVYIGGSGVTSSNGFELQPGQAVPFTVDNVADLYVIGGTGSDKVCWNVL